MIKNGTIPTIKTWTAMITGCGVARDVQAVESIWQKMIEAGVEPDLAAWTARIHSTLSCGKFKEGTRLMDTMGEAWLLQARKTLLGDGRSNKSKKRVTELDELGDFPGAPKP